MTHIDTMSGKYAKTDQVYTRVRKFDDQVIGVRLKHPNTNEPPTEQQLAAQTKLKAVAALVKAVLADASQRAALKAEWKAQKKCKTLTGYVFRKLYAEAQEGGN